MGTTKLAVMNLALSALKQERIRSTDQNVEGARLLSEIYDQTVLLCLEEAPFNFSLKSDEITGTETSDEVGWTYEYAIPDDFIRLDRLRDPDDPVDSDGWSPVVYDKENGKLYGNELNIRIRYVSSTLGTSETNWTPSFEHFVAYSLAKATPKLAGGQADIQRIETGEKRYRRQARQKDAVQQSGRRSPMNRFAKAHLGRSSSSRWIYRHG